MTAVTKPVLAMTCAALAALGLVACTQAVSTSGFKGEQLKVAQTIANLQSDVTAGNDAKICADDLANAIVRRLDASAGGCKQAIKNQLDEVDSLELAVKSVRLSTTAGSSATTRLRSTGANSTATVGVRSVYGGKTRAGTVSLVKEGGKWKITGAQ